MRRAGTSRLALYAAPIPRFAMTAKLPQPRRLHPSNLFVRMVVFPAIALGFMGLLGAILLMASGAIWGLRLSVMPLIVACILVPAGASFVLLSAIWGIVVLFRRPVTEPLEKPAQGTALATFKLDPNSPYPAEVQIRHHMNASPATGPMAVAGFLLLALFVLVGVLVAVS